MTLNDQGEVLQQYSNETKYMSCLPIGMGMVIFGSNSYSKILVMKEDKVDRVYKNFTNYLIVKSNGMSNKNNGVRVIK